MKLEELISNCNSNQKKAITHNLSGQGPVFVLAGAGSGKTSVLTNRIVFLIDHGISPISILALTFTEAAAAEMSERACANLKQLDYTGNCLPKACTFHSLGYRIIRESVLSKPNWHYAGFGHQPRLLEGQSYLDELKHLKNSLEIKVPLSKFQEWIEGPREVPLEDGDLITAQKLRSQFAQILRKKGFLRFDDMVPLALELLEKNPVILDHYRGLFQYILVDEYQDTSPDQLALTRLLSSPGQRLFLVGDDDQAIYGFRGADSQSVPNLFKAYPDIKVIKLETNYRSTAEVLKYSNTIFRQKPPELRKKLIPGNPGASALFKSNIPVSLHIHSTSLNEGRWILQEIKRFQRDFNTPFEHFALLYRLNSQAPYYRSLIGNNLGVAAADAIVFSTIHASKGLQYPIVFLVGLEQGIFPHCFMGKALTIERLEEERRLFYVGVTRAESVLFISACKKRMTRGKMRKHKVSQFVFEAGSWPLRYSLRIKNALASFA